MSASELATRLLSLERLLDGNVTSVTGPPSRGFSREKSIRYRSAKAKDVQCDDLYHTLAMTH